MNIDFVSVTNVFHPGSPVNSRGWIRSCVIADPHSTPVQFHCYMIFVAFVQQDPTVFIRGNLVKR